MSSSNFLLLLFSLLSAVQFISATRKLGNSSQTHNPLSFQYHNGSLLTGEISINLIWYGNFKPSQRAIITDFVASLSSSKPVAPQPSVASWWKATNKFYKKEKKAPLSLSLGKQILDQHYSLGKSLTTNNITALASANAAHKNIINVVLTAADVTVEGFCLNKCGTHGSSSTRKNKKFTYIWVGNSETQCPGQCAWPFHKAMYGPETPALVAPNNDVGMDGMVINLATLMAGTATNPFGDGFYQGSKVAFLEVGSICSGIYGKGAYPGYPGELLVDAKTGGSYNGHGSNGRKYLLPALFDPSTSTCAPLL